MSTSAVTKRFSEMSPLFQARMGGFCWLMTFVTSALAMSIATKLIVARDAAATATNLLANETLFQWSTAALLISGAFYVGATLFVYEVLKPVNRSLSLLAAFFSLVGCAIGALACVFDVVPFVLLKGGQIANIFTAEQLQALTLVVLNARVQANNFGLVFFGLHCLGVGYLIFRSLFLPRVIGALMMFAGLGWLTFLFPPLANNLALYNMIPGGVGELSLTLWLLVKGVDVQRWKEQAGGAVSAENPNSRAHFSQSPT
jgi:hypothetical protein